VQAKGDDLLGTSTVIINGPGINLYNLNIRNDGGVKSQAIALTSSGDNQAVYACQLLGEQDTFYADRGSILVTHSLITGVTGKCVPAILQLLTARLHFRTG
jgi:pectinesterase